MASNKFQPPPTYAEPILINKNLPESDPGRSKFNPIWLKWFLDLSANMGASAPSAGGGGGGAATFPASTVLITDDTTTNATEYPVWVKGTSGQQAEYISSTKITWNPLLGDLTLAGNLLGLTMTMDPTSYNPRIIVRDNTASTGWNIPSSWHPWVDFYLTNTATTASPAKSAIRMDITSDRASGQEVTTGVYINIATQKDSGGDVSGISISQVGNGNAMSLFRTFLSYSTGTASRTLTTVTGTGTAWTSAMVGGTIVFANGTTSLITAVGGLTTLTTSSSGAVADQAYLITYNNKLPLRDIISRQYGLALEATSESNTCNVGLAAANNGLALSIGVGPDSTGGIWGEGIRILPTGTGIPAANLDKIYAILVRDTGNNLDAVGASVGHDTFRVMLDGGTVIGYPTGAHLGAGTLNVENAAQFGGGVTIQGAGGGLPIVTVVDTRASGATASFAANANGLGKPGVFSTSTFPLYFGASGNANDLFISTAHDVTIPNGNLSVTGNAFLAGSGSTGYTQAPGDNSTKLATTAFVSAAIGGLTFKSSVKYTTAAALPANTYANGALGVGATLTGNAVGVLTVDGNATVLNDEILVKDEATQANNGIYKVTTAGTAGVAYVLTRRTDADQSAEYTVGFQVLTIAGTANVNTTWGYNGAATPTMGTTALTFVQTSGVNSYTAGNGLLLVASQFKLDDTSTTLNIFTAATALGVGAATGTLTVNNTTLAAKAGTFSTTLGVTGATTLSGTTSFGGNIISDILFTDATYDIGKSGATRPRDIFLSRNLTVGSLTSTEVVFAGTNGILLGDSASLSWTVGTSTLFTKNLLVDNLATTVTLIVTTPPTAPSGASVHSDIAMLGTSNSLSHDAKFYWRGDQTTLNLDGAAGFYLYKAGGPQIHLYDTTPSDSGNAIRFYGTTAGSLQKQGFVMQPNLQYFSDTAFSGAADFSVASAGTETGGTVSIVGDKTQSGATYAGGARPAILFSVSNADHADVVFDIGSATHYYNDSYQRGTIRAGDLTLAASYLGGSGTGTVTAVTGNFSGNISGFQITTSWLAGGGRRPLFVDNTGLITV